MNRKQYLIAAVVYNILALPIFIMTVGIHGEFLGVVMSIMVGAPVIVVSLFAIIPVYRYKEENGMKGLKILFIYGLIMLSLATFAWPIAIGASIVLGMCVDALFYERKMKSMGIDIHAPKVEKDKFKKM